MELHVDEEAQMSLLICSPEKDVNSNAAVVVVIAAIEFRQDHSQHADLQKNNILLDTRFSQGWLRELYPIINNQL